MTGPSAMVSDAEAPARATTWADVRLVGYIAVVDLVYVAGVLVPYLTRADHPTTGAPAWLGWPAFATLFLMPMVAVAVGAVAAGRLGAGGGRRWPALVAALLAVAGFATYVSPLGVAAVRWFLD
ncbi:MAG TPA: hypothetical protein VFR56_05700 [Actinomycetes bacterium]|nr:hypothetical protein [Actinomycetes bacterium]